MGMLVGMIIFAVLWGITLAAAVYFALRKPKVTGVSQEELDRRLEEEKASASLQLDRQAEQFNSSLDEKRTRIKELEAQVDSRAVEVSELKVRLAQSEVALQGEREQLKTERENYQKVQAENETRFRDIAQKVIDASQEKMKQSGEESIGNLVAPLMKDIKAFREKVESVNVADAERAAQLTQKIEGLVQQTNNVSSKASELAQAIRGEAQVTGQWAEIQLKRILELSGLKETIDYTYQETFAGEGSDRKNLRTDVLVKISEKEWIVIDSKNTMESYVSYVGAEEQDREVFLKRIVESVKGHVDELKSAEYQKNLGKAFKYAFMYIPFEEVYLIAMKAEVKTGGERVPLREYARRNNVIFVNSTSLLPTLQLVAVTWQNQRSDRKAAKIKEECEGLCKKVETFLDSYQELGKYMAKAVGSYGAGLGQLATGRGNMLGRFRKLAELDVPAAAELPDESEYAEGGAKQIEIKVPLVAVQETREVETNA